MTRPSLYEYKRMGLKDGYKVDKDLPLDTPKQDDNRTPEERKMESHYAYRKMFLKG